MYCIPNKSVDRSLCSAQYQCEKRSLVTVASVALQPQHSVYSSSNLFFIQYDSEFTHIYRKICIFNQHRQQHQLPILLHNSICYNIINNHTQTKTDKTVLDIFHWIDCFCFVLRAFEICEYKFFISTLCSFVDLFLPSFFFSPSMESSTRHICLAFEFYRNKILYIY